MNNIPVPKVNSCVRQPQESPCTLPYAEAYTPDGAGPQVQLNAPTLPSDLETQLYLTGYAGGQRRGASDIDIPVENPDLVPLDDFGPLIPGARDPFLGPPSAARARKFMYNDPTLPVKREYPWKIKKPDIRDFAPSMPVGAWVGEPGDVKPEDECQCVKSAHTPWTSVRAFMISEFNYKDLYDTLFKHGIVLGVKQMVVYPPRKVLCLCSWIGRSLAAEYVNFSERQMISPASKELNLKETIQSENEAFAQNVLSRLFSSMQQIQRRNYDKAAGRLRGLQVRPEFDRDAPPLPKKITELGASNLPQTFGPYFASNPETYAGAWALSKPASIWNEDFKKWTGIDYTNHKNYTDIPMR